MTPAAKTKERMRCCGVEGGGDLGEAGDLKRWSGR